MSTTAFLYFDSTCGYQEIFQVLEKRLKQKNFVIIHSHLLDDYNEFEIETNELKLVYEFTQQHRLIITVSADFSIQSALGLIEKSLGKKLKINRLEYDS